MKQSATWADVVKFANLYAVTRDTQTSLDEVLRNTNSLIEQVGPNVLVCAIIFALVARYSLQGRQGKSAREKKISGLSDRKLLPLKRGVPHVGL
jgi:hypothetical protein